MKKKTPKRIASARLKASVIADAKRSVDAAQRIARRILKQNSTKKTSTGEITNWSLFRSLNKQQLVVKRGKTFALTTSGKLQQSRALNLLGNKQPKIVSGFRLQLNLALNQSGRGVAIDKLVPLAANELEQNMFRLIHKVKPGLFAEYDDPQKALLHLRVLHVPRLCRGFLNNEIERNEAGILWLGAMSAYVVASRRTLLERLYRAAYKSGVSMGTTDELQKWASRTFSGNVDTWFDKAEEGFQYWLSRFDQWLEYAMRSLDHYYERQSKDYREGKWELKQAAQLGILKLLDALPESYFADMLKGVNASDATRRMFKKNAKKRPTEPTLLDFQSWLIECWPLVLEYNWNYLDVQRAANEKFDASPVHARIKKVRDLKKLCKDMHLKIGRIASSKVGRPRQNQDSGLPRMIEVALQIEGLQDSEWAL